MPALLPPVSRASVAAGAAAIVAAVLGYSIHHFGPLQDHAVESVLIGLAAAALLAALPAAAAASRPALPELVVAAPGSHEIRAAAREDAGFCAALHADSLPHGFFTQLGPAFLRAYHETFIESPHAIAYVATVRTVPVGMVVGSVHPAAHARWVMRHRGVRLALLGAAGLALHPVTGLHFLQRRAGRYLRGWRRYRRPGAADRVTASESAVLSHVAVVPGFRRTGAGSELVEAFVEACRARDVPRVTLLTMESATGAGAFYAGLGWRAGEVRVTPDGHRMRQWVLFTGDR
jgi:ribosomal protein S18 acetylase RimI-like enzyme